MRTLVLGVLLLSAGSALADGRRPAHPWQLPAVLARHGFGDPRVPVTITLNAPIGRETARPVHATTKQALPHNTQWVFRDPAPVWRALEAARTTRFLEGQFPGAAARLTIEVGSVDATHRIHLHYGQGHGDISVRRKGRARGGAWEFDPAADAALVALLSRTKPTLLGAPVLRVHQVFAKAPGNAPRIVAIEDAQALETWKPRLAWRYPETSSWKMPQGFDWKTHFLVLVQSAEPPTRRLDYGNAQLKDGILRWRLWTKPEKKKAPVAGRTSAVVGVFARPRYLTHIRADIDEHTQVERRLPMNDDYPTPQPDAVFLRVKERYHTGKAWVSDTHTDIWLDGRYVQRMPWRKSPGPPARIRASRYGRIPQALCMRLRKSFKARPTALAADTATRTEYVLHLDDTKTEKPDGIQELVDYIARVHRRP